MTKKSFCRIRARLAGLLCAGAFLFAGGAAQVARAAGLDAPIILSEPTTTRAIAIDALTKMRDPFPLTTPGYVASTSDRRTRVMFFVLNLGLLSGEGANALTADAEDSAHVHHPLIVESVNSVPGVQTVNGLVSFEAIQAIVVRLSDDLNDVGDVLVRINLHGVSSNRVRVSIGHVGGAISDDDGSVPTPAPPTPPAPTPTPTPNPYNDPALAAGPDGVRFLEQVTWGPTAADLAHLRSVGFRAYLNEQFNAPASGYPNLPLFAFDSNVGCPSDPNNPNARPLCLRDNYSMYPLQLRFYQNALYGPDQLRQRVAFALSQILVVSGRDIQLSSWMSPYLQVINRNAFGNFRQLLSEMTLNPAMGRYLDMAGNNKANPNENYAREILQLFSVGLNQLNQDGTLRLDAQGNAIPTYDQATITNFARVFTGWVIQAVPGQAGVLDYISPMTVTRESNHDTNQKVLLNGATLPANQTSAPDLNGAIDNIFNHPNVAPFICRQLIQHLVTSNPSPAYVGRVAAVFNDNGSGVRGDLQAVATAILLDPEARGDQKTDPAYGHLREPAQLITNVLRAFNAKSASGSSNSDGYLAPMSLSMDEDIFRAPSVFNYYQPDYEVPGTNLLGPEFGILSTATALKRANFINTMIYSRINASGANSQDPNNPGTGTSIDLAGWQQANAPTGDPQQIADALNTQLMHGAMSSAMRASIVQAASVIPTTDAQYQLKRVQAAVYLVATSSQYQVER